MKKRRFGLSALLIMSVVLALILSIIPVSVLAANAAGTALSGTKLTTAHAGQTLTAGEYYVEPGATLTLRGGTGKSGLKIAGNSTVTINVPAGSTLNVYGGAASGTTGAGAGIEVVSGSNLKVIGSGTLNAYGGKAANGSSGASGETARWGDDTNSYIPDSGYGGSGGGGAGAGIGTKGGNGGSGTGWTLAMSGRYYRTTWTDNFKNKNVSGSNGSDGGNGESASACGGIFIQTSVTVKATGGAQGTSGGSGGSAGSKDYESDDHWMRGMAGGSGGGGGGSGKAGANFGTGGGGGGGGGAGGGIGYVWSYRFLGAGGGGGGAGAVGGSGGAWSSDGEISGCKEWEHFGGMERYSSSGSAGGKDSGRDGGNGAKLKIKDWSETYWEYPYAGNGGRGGDAGSNCSEKGYQALYKVSINNGESTAVYYASADQFLPTSLDVQGKVGHTFKGYYGGETQYYDENGNRTDARITGDVTISAKLDVNKYDYTIKDSDGNVDSTLSGSAEYGASITLNTPSRDGFLFRGWKISASSGKLNSDAYYTYSTVAPVMRMMMRSSNQSPNQSFIQNGSSFQTAGADKIGSSVTLYNLSADDGADLTIEEMWVKDYFEVTFKDFDGNVIGTRSGKFVDMISAPAIPDNTSEYYTYTFKYWKCNIDDEYYKTDKLPNMGAFLPYESELGDTVYTGITFTAVYDIEYKKELHFVGSLGNDNLDMTDTVNFPNGVLILGEGNTNVPVITNFKIAKNDGVASLLLIPQYDASVFNIKAISINGESVYGEGATSNAVLSGFKVTITGTETESDMLKILLDNLTPDATVSEDIFVQIVYEMNTAIGGRYEFGFITADYDSVDTDMITHGDRSEAYGTYDPDVSTDKDAWRFNELKITVDSTAINVVVRVNGKIEITDKQTFVYNGQQMSAADVTEEILNALQYTYNGFAKKESDTLTIKWYDAQGNELLGAPKDVGTYKVRISAAQTTYYYAADEVEATFKITPYEIFIVAGDQTLEYSGSNIVINGGASQGGIFIKDNDGNLIPVDEFVNSELTFSGVELVQNYVNAGEYLEAIKGILAGDIDNYTVTYENGTLIITKAVNEWVTLPNDKTVEYSGNSVTLDGVSAQFGNVKVEYLVGYDKDKDEGIWSETPPVNAGVYPVLVTVAGTDNYTDLSYEVTLVITKKIISADGFTFDAIDKIYNGEVQNWTILEYAPDGSIETEEEIRVLASAENAHLLQYVKFAGVFNPQDCINAGKYKVQAVLNISDPNYTFKAWNEKTQKYDEIDYWTYNDVEVEILKRRVNVTVGDQSSEYNGSEPTVKQGEGYFTVTLEDGTTPRFVTIDFFGGMIYVTAGDTFDPSVDYYVRNEDGSYSLYALTEEEFKSNLNSENDHVKYYVMTNVSSSEILTLLKAEGVNAGDHVLKAILETIESNYELVTVNNGTYTITKQIISIPTFDSVEYNGQIQQPTISTELYIIVSEGYRNAGDHEVILALVDPANYRWTNGSSANEAVSWKITKKAVTVILPDASRDYVYGDLYLNPVIEWNGTYIWDSASSPIAGDDIIIGFGFGEEYYLHAGTHYASVLDVSGEDADNYAITKTGGKVVISPKEITEEMLKAHIEAVLKYYSSNAQSWSENDFTTSLLNLKGDGVLGIFSVAQHGFTDANGIYNSENETFTYHGETRYYANVTVELLDTQNYTLPVADVEVEVKIAKAQNAWTTHPSVDSTNINAVKPIAAKALFGDLEDVKFYTEIECNTLVSGGFDANTTYYAKFIVDGNNNYYGLETIIAFSGSHITIIKPVVKFDSATGEVVAAGKQITIVYDGGVHSFVVPAPAGGEYTVTRSTDEAWKNAGTYTVTVKLANNYAWEDGTNTELVYTLVINKATLTIKADNKTITYKADPPAYSYSVSGLVAGEIFDDLLGDNEGPTLACDYAKGNNVGTYTISVIWSGSLSNYEVVLENGTLTVKKYFDNIQGETPWTNFTDVIFVYNGQNREYVIDRNIHNVHEIFDWTITYSKDGVALGEGVLPKDAGRYKVEITLSLNISWDDAKNNYGINAIPIPAPVSLVINKAQITITAEDKTYVYNGTDYYNQFNNEASSGIGRYYTLTFDNVDAFDDGSEITIKLANGKYVNAGTYVDKIIVEHNYSDANYEVTVVCGDLIITKAANKWTNALYANGNIVYDKSAVEKGTDFNSRAEFGDGSVVYKFYQIINNQYIELATYPKNAGTYYVKAIVAETSNYEGLDSGYVTLVINKATITIAGVTFVDGEFYYNGEALYIFADNYADLFDVSYADNGKTNAGTYTVTATFTPKDTANYELDGENSLSAKLTIKKVKVTITAQDKNSMFGDPIAALTYGIVFEGADGYESFYSSDWGRIVLSTAATDKSNVGTYIITSQTISENDNYDISFNEGTYTITKYTNNEVTINAENVRYLMDLVYSATADRGQNTIKFTFATSADGPFTDELPKNVGTYYVKATIAGTDNYNGAEATVSFEIQKATLSKITNITYDKDTATWTAVVTTTDGKTIDCTVSYRVGELNLNTPSFTATSAGSFSVIAVPSDTNNYNNSAEVTLATVYSVEFADTADNHERQTNLADLTAPAFATQYRFEGQAVTRPDAIPTVVGYTFREWMLGNSGYNFASGVNSNITLYAGWNINTYTINFYNEIVTGSRIEDGIFIEGAISEELFGSKTFEYGDTIVFIEGIPTKAGDDIYTYAFAYWADALRGNEVANTYTVTDNDSFYAVYASTAKEFTITYMVSVDGGKYFVKETVKAPYGTQLISLENVRWFIGDVWYKDQGRSTPAPSFVPAMDTELYGAYVFDIGAGDVNADGEIDVDDITLYRRWIVGGYNIVSIAPGNEWNIATSEDFNTTTVYFIERVNDANRDDSGDIRDITTVRMALTGGYGYTYVSGLDSLAGVSGEGVIFVLDTIPGVCTPDSLMAAINDASSEKVYIKLTEDIKLNNALKLENGKNVTINLNGQTLTMGPENHSNYVAVVKNGTLTIEGEGTVIVPGAYGFGTASNTTTGHIVINGGTFIGENVVYMLACFNGSITVNGGSFTADYCVLNGFDGYNGVATVNGGEFTVTGEDEEYPSSIFLGNVTVNGAPTYHVRSAEDLGMSFANGGNIILEADIELDASLTVPAGKTVVLDMNGHNVSYTTDVAATSQVIWNNGTLTILGEGAINYHSTGSDTSSMPRYATNAITNRGRLTIGAGVTVQNNSDGGASYAVDNSGYFHLDGGTLKAKGTALRVCNFSASATETIVDSGLIEGIEGLRIQLAGNDANVAPKVKVTVNGGTLRSTKGTDGFAFTTYSFGNSYSDTTVTINGGEFYGWVTVGTGNSDSVTVTVNGGEFDCYGVYDYAKGYYITTEGIVSPEAE